MAKQTTTKTEVTEKGVKAGGALKRETSREERKVETAKGSDLKKGAARVDERAKAANGKGPQAK